MPKTVTLCFKKEKEKEKEKEMEKAPLQLQQHAVGDGSMTKRSASIKPREGQQPRRIPIPLEALFGPPRTPSPHFYAVAAKDAMKKAKYTCIPLPLEEFLGLPRSTRSPTTPSLPSPSNGEPSPITPSTKALTKARRSSHSDVLVLHRNKGALFFKEI
ncbi:unnamed protein product [Cutaneotrichosporon oleaginosum]